MKHSLEPACQFRRHFSNAVRAVRLCLWIVPLAVSISGCALTGVRIVQAPGVSPLVTATPAYQLKVAVKNYNDKDSSPPMQLRVTMQLNKASDVGGRGGAPDCYGHHTYAISPLAPQQEWSKAELIQDINGCGGCAFLPAMGIGCAGVVGLKLSAAAAGGAKLEGSDVNVTWSINGAPSQVTEVPR